MSLKATEKEACLNAGSWGKCQGQSSQRGWDGTKRRFSRSGQLEVEQAIRDAQGGLVPGGRHILLALEEEPKKGTPALLVPSL